MIKRILLLLSGVAIGAAVTYYIDFNRFEKQRLDYKLEAQEEVNRGFKQAQINTEALQNKYNQLHAESLMDQATIKQLEQELSKAHEDLSSATDSLAFYESMGPASDNANVSLRSFEVNPWGENRLHFKVLLFRNASVDGEFNGRLQFIATGLLDGKEKEVELFPEVQATEETKTEIDPAQPQSPPEVKTAKEIDKSDLKAALGVKLKRIQTLQGLLVIPNGFEPSSVSVKILQGSRVVLAKKLKLKP